MKNIILFFLLLLARGFAVAQSSGSRPFVIGESITLHSTLLAEDRTLNIYLPEGYATDTAHYRVIYLLDGSAGEDFIHIAGLVQFMDLMYNMPKTIVVGIANTDRKRDFTFHSDLKAEQQAYPVKGQTGQSGKFIRFLSEELQPFVEKNYRVRADKTIIGQSLGGLLATEILLKQPALFHNYIIVSPSLWWDRESLLKQAPALLAARPDNQRKICLFVGKEGKIMEGDAKGLADAIRASGKKNTQLHFLSLNKENHATILHQAVFEALKLWFPYNSGN